MTLLRPLLSIFSLAAVLQLASGIEYTDNGVAIVGTTESLDINVTAGTSREDLISYEFASYIAVHFAGFNLPDGDSVVITSPDDNSTVSHTYVGRGRDQSGTFIASFIPGNSATVTYNSVGAASTGQGYRITGFSRGYPTMDQESICGGGDQSLPAKCYAPGSNLSEGLPQAYKKAQAVARLLINGTYLCTGWLGGSEGHLFTNHHCFEQEEWALNTDFEFAAESSSCSDQCETQLGCAGKIVATTSTFIADSEDIDYSVVQLPDCVDLSPYGYLQLRESGPVVNESIYVPQHPDGYAKRIASTVDDGSDATILSVGMDGSCGTDQVGHDADTQGGSSGSPLISTSDNLVVAIHHCGGCANAAIDVRTVLTDLASKNITIENLVASDDDAGQSDPPSYAQTPCSAQSSKNSTHTARNHTMPCRNMTKQGSSKTALKTAASNATSIVVSAANKTTPSPTPAASTLTASSLGTVAASTNAPSAASTKTSSTVTTSNSTSATTSASTTTTSKTDTKGSTSSSVSTTTSASKTALTSASVVTSTKATTTSSAPSTATKASSTPVSSVTSSSSSKTTSTSSVSNTSTTVSTSTSTTTSSKSADCDSTAVSTSSPSSTAGTVDNNTIVGKLKAAVVGLSSPASTSAATKTGLTPAATPKTTTPTPVITSTRASAAPLVARSPVTPSPTSTSTPKPSASALTTSTVATPAPIVLGPATPLPTTTSTTPASTAISTPKPTTTRPPAATPASTISKPSPTPTSTPKPTPASTSVESSGSSGWGDVEQN